MASEEPREPGAPEQSTENEVVKQSSPHAKELFTVTIGASLVLFLCLGGIVFYLKTDDNDHTAPGPPTRSTGSSPKQDTPNAPSSTSSAASAETGTTLTTQTGGNQSSLHEELLQAEDSSET